MCIRQYGKVSHKLMQVVKVPSNLYSLRCLLLDMHIKIAKTKAKPNFQLPIGSENTSDYDHA